MIDKVITVLNVLAPGAVISAVGVAAIKAWSNRPENLARAKKINMEADGPVISGYKQLILDYQDQMKQTEDRWEKRFNDQALEFNKQIVALQDRLSKYEK